MTVRIVRGTVEDLLFTVTEVDDGDRVDLTALPIEFLLSPRDGSGTGDPAISKTAADFVLRDQTQTATKGQADLKLTAAETALLLAVTHIAKLFVTAAGDRRRTLYEHVPVE